MLNFIKNIIGTKNDKEVKKYLKRVEKINLLESKYEKLIDDELKKNFNELREAISNGSKTLDEVLNDSFAITREASKRVLNMRHYDVQIVGGLVLNDGRIAEMKTGEGKTLVATLPVVLNAMSQKGVHVVTVNDYLSERDVNELKPLYNFLGFSVAYVTSRIAEDKRKEAYMADITYGTNNEFGFDFLRDNMKYSLEEKVQRKHNFVIVDEVDSILIDEARTPLIISGPTNKTLENYQKAHNVAIKLEKGEIKAGKEPNQEITTGDFSVDEKNRVILLTDEGITKAEKLFGVENLYSLENAILSHHLDQALKANHLFEKDVDYVVQNNEIIIVDEFTGRLSEGRRFSEGLHQALEAKEKVKIQEESQTLADITFQNYFRMYNKLAGMTGTAQTEATEFAEIYNLDVVSIPTNVPVIRKDLDDLIYKTEREKFEAVVKKVKTLHKNGQPVLIGTASIEKSEILHAILKKEKVPHTVLNAKQHDKEANIIINAGKKGSVTIATNMAGRGVDIKIDDEVRELGGLYILGTERHESRRIDNQLRGRSGRQGDSGVSQFYLSLEDNLLRIFGSDKIKVIMEKLGIEEGEHIESRMVTRAVQNAQKKVEALHFESRKHLLEYDDIANQQRQVVYKFRDDLLNDKFDIQAKLRENQLDYVNNILAMADIFEDIPAEDFDKEMLSKHIQEELHNSKFDLNYESFELLKESLFNAIIETYENKMQQLEPTQRSQIERIIYLQILDNSWREHLYQMDIMKTGIGLRGYNQKDPLVEYKKESYNLFMEFIEAIKNEVVQVLFNFQITSPEEEEAERERIEASLRAVNEDTQTSNDIKQTSEITKKIPRNSICPCGSGKKYKQCCGKSGPKKGILAK